MAKWIKTSFPGIRYREHPTRKHGQKKDRYYVIRWKVDRIEKSLGMGWESEWKATDEDKRNGIDTLYKKSYELLKEMKSNTRAAEGPQSLKEKRLLLKAEQERQQKEALSFSQIFEEKYLPVSKANKKKDAADTEKSLNKLWINPVIGKLALKDISPIHLERIKKNMADVGRSPRTINYALSVIRQLYNFSKNIGLYTDECPVKKVKIPREDNRRLRFLTYEESQKILSALKEKSQDVHDMALLSLHCGLRAGEVFSLTWADVDIKKGILTLRNTKSGRTRHGYMTEVIKIMFALRNPSNGSELVFPATTGAQRDRISKTFTRVIEDLGLNKGITDNRQKAVWHSLRHTFASWLVQSGISLYTVQHLMGHENISQTERYSHLKRETLQDAVKIFERDIKQIEKQDEVITSSSS